MKQNLIDIPYCITRRSAYQGVRCPVSNQAGNDKQAIGWNQNRNKKLDLRKEYKVGIWNVRKIKETGKLNTICNKMRRNDVHTLGLSETNWNGNGRFKMISKHTVLFAGKENGYGVGFILTSEIVGAVIGYNPFNDRIISVQKMPDFTTSASFISVHQHPHLRRRRLKSSTVNYMRSSIRFQAVM